MRTVLFDFDKTLTYKDTMNQFFFWRMSGIRILYMPVFLFLVILTKLKVLSVKRLKEISIKMLAPRKKEELITLFKNFSKKIELSETTDILNKNIEDGNKVIILSASPIYYIQELFPTIDVIGTTFTYDLDEKFCKFATHPYGEEKLSTILAYGYDTIDEMYYDSKSDEVLFAICKTAYKIVSGKIVKTKTQ